MVTHLKGRSQSPLYGRSKRGLLLPENLEHASDNQTRPAPLCCATKRRQMTNPKTAINRCCEMDCKEISRNKNVALMDDHDDVKETACQRLRIQALNHCVHQQRYVALSQIKVGGVAVGLKKDDLVAISQAHVTSFIIENLNHRGRKQTKRRVADRNSPLRYGSRKSKRSPTTSAVQS